MVNNVVKYENNKVSINTPENPGQFVAYIKPTDEINLAFDLAKLKVDVVRGDIHIVFPDNSTITLVAAAVLYFSGQLSAIRDESGNVISLEDWLYKEETIAYNKAKLILSNRDEVSYSDREYDVIRLASEHDSTLEAGIPVSGVGNTDQNTIGTPSSKFNPNATSFISKPYDGKDLYVVTLNFTNTPNKSDSSSNNTGDINQEKVPELSYKVFYGSKFSQQASVDMNGVSYEYYRYKNGYKSTDDPKIQAVQNTVDLSAETRNLYINNNPQLMTYLVEADFSKGVFPNKITLSLPNRVDSIVGLAFDNPETFAKSKDLENNTIFVANNPDPLGKIKYSISFPPDTDPTNFEITYKLEYFNPALGTNDNIFVVQSIVIAPVYEEKDASQSAANVLSSVPNGLNIVTGSGDDVVVLGGGLNNAQTGFGNDKIFTGNGSDVVTAGAGDDIYWASAGSDIVDMGLGNDIVYYNNIVIPIDDVEDNFSSNYYNTYTQSRGVNAYLGADIATQTKVISGSQNIERFGQIFKDGLVINGNQIIKAASDGDILIKIGSSNALYQNTEKMVLSILADTLYAYSSSSKVYDIDAERGRDTLVIAEEFGDDANNLGAIVKLAPDVITNYLTVTTKSNVLKLNFLNVEKYVGSNNSDIFYTYYNPEYKDNPQNYYQISGSAAGTNAKDRDTISYLLLDGYVSFDAESGNAWKMKYDNGVLVSQIGELESVTNFEVFEGSKYADQVYGSAVATRNYEFLDADSSLATNGQKDDLTYSRSRSGVSVDLANALVYKIANAKSINNLSGVAFDKIGSGYNISYTNNIDVLFSNEGINIDQNSNLKIDGAGGNDILSYYDFKNSIELDLTSSTQATVNKAGGSFKDIFDYLTHKYVANPSVAPVNDIINIAKIEGTTLVDTIFLGNWFLSTPITITYEGNNVGTSGDILDLTRATIATPSTEGFIINLSATNTVKAYGTSNLFAPTLQFGGVDVIKGSSGGDFIIFGSGLASINEINKYDFDLGAGLDTVDFRNVSGSLLGKSTVSLKISFVNGNLNVIYGELDDDAMQESDFVVSNSSSTFINTEFIVGTSYNDYFIADNTSSLKFDGFAGRDIADYSAVTSAIIADFASRLDNNIQKGSVFDTVKAIEVFIAGTGGTEIFGGDGSIYFKIPVSSNPSTLSYEKYSGSIVVTFVENTTTKEIETVITKSNTNIDMANSEIKTIIGSDKNDIFVLYDLALGSTVTIKGTKSTSILDTDIVDLSAAKAGITLTLSSNGGLNFTFGNGTWVLESIEGAKLTNFNDKVILSGDAQYNIDGLGQSLGGNDIVDYTGYTGATMSALNLNLALSSQAFNVYKFFKDISIATKTDILTNMEEILFADTDDTITITGDVTKKNNSIKKIDTAGGSNSLSISGVINNINFTLTNTSISSTDLGIEILGISKISSTSETTTTYNITEAITTSTYDIRGDLATKAESKIKFDSLTQGGLTFNFNTLDNVNRVTYLSVLTSGSANFITRLNYSNIDEVTFTKQNDTIKAGEIKNIKYDGLEGTDTLSYEDYSNQYVTITISTKQIQFSTSASTHDSYANIEQITGTKNNDVVKIDDNVTQAMLDATEIDLLEETGTFDKIQLNYKAGITFDLVSGISSGSTNVTLGNIKNIEDLILTEFADTVKLKKITTALYDNIYAGEVFNSSVLDTLDGEDLVGSYTFKTELGRKISIIEDSTSTALPGGFVFFNKIDTTKAASAMTFKFNAATILTIAVSTGKDNIISFEDSTANAYYDLGQGKAYFGQKNATNTITFTGKFKEFKGTKSDTNVDTFELGDGALSKGYSNILIDGNNSGITNNDLLLINTTKSATLIIDSGYNSNLTMSGVTTSVDKINIQKISNISFVRNSTTTITDANQSDIIKMNIVDKDFSIDGGAGDDVIEYNATFFAYNDFYKQGYKKSLSNAIDIIDSIRNMEHIRYTGSGSAIFTGSSSTSSKAMTYSNATYKADTASLEYTDVGDLHIVFSTSTSIYGSMLATINKGKTSTGVINTTNADKVYRMDHIKFGNGNDSLSVGVGVDFSSTPLVLDLGGGKNAIELSKTGIITIDDLSSVVSGLTVLNVTSYKFGDNTNETYNGSWKNTVIVGGVATAIFVSIDGGSKSDGSDIDTLDYSALVDPANNSKPIDITIQLFGIQQQVLKSGGVSDDITNFEKYITGGGNDTLKAGERLKTGSFQSLGRLKEASLGGGLNIIDFANIDNPDYYYEYAYTNKQLTIVEKKVSDKSTNATAIVRSTSKFQDIVLAGNNQDNTFTYTANIGELGSTISDFTKITGSQGSNSSKYVFNFNDTTGLFGNLYVKDSFIGTQIFKDDATAANRKAIFTINNFGGLFLNTNKNIIIEVADQTVFKNYSITRASTASATLSYSEINLPITFEVTDYAKYQGNVVITIAGVDKTYTSNGFNIINLGIGNDTVDLQEIPNTDTNIYFTIDGKGGSDTISLSGFKAAGNFYYGASGFSLAGYTLTNFEDYSLTNLGDTLRIRDGYSLTVSGADGVDSILYINSTTTSDVASTLYAYAVSEALIIDKNTTKYLWNVLKSDTATSTILLDSLYNFENITLGVKNDIYNVGNYDLATLNSLTTLIDVDINMGVQLSGGQDIISFDLSKADSISYLVNNIGTGGNNKTTIQSSYGTGASPVIATHKVSNMEKIVGHNGKDLFSVSIANFATLSSVILLDGVDANNDEFIITYTKPTTPPTPPTPYPEVVLNVSGSVAIITHATKTLQVQNVSIFRLGDENDKITGRASGSYSFYVGGGTNTFDYASGGLLQLNVEYSYDVANSQERYTFNKGSGVDNVYGSIATVNLNELSNAFTLTSFNRAFIYNSTVDGKESSDTLLYNIASSFGDITAILGESILIILTPEDTTTAQVIEEDRINFVNFENFDLRTNLSKVQIYTTLATANVSTPIVLAKNTITIDTLELVQRVSTTAVNVFVNLNSAIIEGDSVTIGADKATFYNMFSFDGTLNTLQDSGSLSNTTITVNLSSVLELKPGLIELGAGSDLLDLSTTTTSITLVKNILALATNKETITMSATSLGTTRTINVNTLGADRIILGIANDTLTLNNAVNDIVIDGGIGSDTANINLKDDGSISLDDTGVVSYNAVITNSVGGGLVKLKSIETLNVTGLRTKFLVDPKYSANNITVNFNSDPSSYGMATASKSVSVSVTATSNTTAASYSLSLNAISVVFNVNSASLNTPSLSLTDNADIINLGVLNQSKPVKINAGDGVDIILANQGGNSPRGKYDSYHSAENKMVWRADLGNINAPVVAEVYNAEKIYVNTGKLYLSIDKNNLPSSNVEIFYAQDGSPRPSGNNSDNDRMLYLPSTANVDVMDILFYNSPSASVANAPIVSSLTIGNVMVQDFHYIDLRDYLTDITINMQSAGKDPGQWSDSNWFVMWGNRNNFETLSITSKPGSLLTLDENFSSGGNGVHFNVSGHNVVYAENFNKFEILSQDTNLQVNGATAGSVSTQPINFYSTGKITVSLGSGYSFDNLTATDTLHLFKHSSAAGFHSINAILIISSVNPLLMPIGNSSYTMNVSRSMTVDKDSNFGIPIEYNFADNTTDELFIDGMINNLVINSGKGLDNIYLSAGATDFMYIYRNDEFYTIDGEKYNTGGNFVLISDGQGHEMLLINTTLDDIVMGGHLVSNDYYNANKNGEQTTLVVDLDTQKGQAVDLYVKPEGSVGKRSLDIVDTNNDGVKDYSDEQNVSNYYSLNYNADNYVRPNAKPSVGVNNNQSNTNSQDNNTDTNNTNDNATANDNNNTKPNNKMSGDVDSQDSNNTNNNEGSVNNKSRKIEDNEDLAIDDMLDSSSKEEERVENDVLNDLLLSEVLGEEIDLDNLNLDSENSSEDDRVDIGNISSETSTSQSDIEDNYKLEDENKNDVLDDLNNTLRKNHDNSLN